MYLADLFAEVPFPLSGVEWYPLCRIVELPPLVVIVVQDFRHHEGRDGEFLDDGFIGGSPVDEGAFEGDGRPEGAVFEEFSSRNGAVVVRGPVEEDEIHRFLPGLVVGAVRPVEFSEFCCDRVVSGVGGCWEDGSAHFVRFFVREIPATKYICNCWESSTEQSNFNFELGLLFLIFFQGGDLSPDWSLGREIWPLERICLQIGPWDGKSGFWREFVSRLGPGGGFLGR